MSGDDACGAEGLQLIDKALAERPHKDDYVLADAMERLCRFRERLIARNKAPGRTPEDGRRLLTLNAVISVLAGVHFPIGETPWDALVAVRQPLADLVGQPA